MTAAPEAAGQQGAALGVLATHEQVAGWDVSVGPDGAGLPKGAGTAREGAQIFAQKCMVCHDEKGQGGANDRLAGGQGTLAAPTPVKTIGRYWPYATTIFDYVRRAVPFLQPQSLSDNEVYALIAYLLNINGIVAEGDVIDVTSLPRVEMPNRDTFVWAIPRQ